jgi:hypothetical protein
MSGEYAGHGRTATFSDIRNCIQILGQCTFMLKHEVMAADEWHNNGPQNLITYLCIQIAIDKLQLCSVSIAYACP